MKKNPFNVRGKFYWLSFTFWLFSHLSLFGQAEDYRARVHSSGAYWRVKTDAKTYFTTIQFFNAHHEIIYQQRLAGQYIKLSEGNARLLDSTLNRLVTNRLLPDQIKRYSLSEPAWKERFKPQAAGSEQPVLRDTASPANPYDLQCYISPRGKVGISFKNPRGKLIYLKLSNAHTTFYEEVFFQRVYNRWLDINDLPSDHYILSFSCKKQRFTYELIIHSQINQTVNYQLSAMETVSK